MLIKSMLSRAFARADILETCAKQVRNYSFSSMFVNLRVNFLDIDECSSSPCENGGTCVDGVDVYTCECMAGYTGDQCETSKS